MCIPDNVAEGDCPLYTLITHPSLLSDDTNALLQLPQVLNAVAAAEGDGTKQVFKSTAMADGPQGDPKYVLTIP